MRLHGRRLVAWIKTHPEKRETGLVSCALKQNQSVVSVISNNALQPLCHQIFRQFPFGQSVFGRPLAIRLSKRGRFRRTLSNPIPRKRIGKISDLKRENARRRPPGMII
jgi:hypothetical protein